MSMTFTDACNAVHDAERTIQNSNRLVRGAADICRGRLRSADVSSYTLAQLKRELRDYNIHTGRWKD